MYSRKVVQEKLEKFAAQEGWTPVEHSQVEVDEFKAYIDSITSIESNSKNSHVSLSRSISEKRAAQVRRWIENEHVMCALDNFYWESRYCHIQGVDGGVVKFKNSKSQDILDSLISELEDDGRAVELLLLTGRQMGMSTKIILKLIHRMLFYSYTDALFGSAQMLHAELNEAVLNTVYRNNPWWLVPMRLPKRKLSNGSQAAFQASTQVNGFSRGFTPKMVFISDVGNIKSPVKKIEDGLLRVVHSSRGTMLVLQGSTGSTKGWFENIWMQSKEFWSQGKSRFLPVFIPWGAATDMYPSEEWLKKYSVPPGWEPAPETADHARLCAEYIDKTPYLAKVLGPNWSLTREQQWFWEFTKKSLKTQGEISNFNLMMCANDEGALQIKQKEADIDDVFPDLIEIRKRFSSVYSTA